MMKSQKEKIKNEIVPVFKKYDNEQSDSPYKAGENLTYLIHYGIINGGKAFLNVDNDLSHYFTPENLVPLTAAPPPRHTPPPSL